MTPHDARWRPLRGAAAALAAVDLYGRTLEATPRAMTVRSSDGRTSALPRAALPRPADGRRRGRPRARGRAGARRRLRARAATCSRSRGAGASRSASTSRPSPCGSPASAAQRSLQASVFDRLPGAGRWGTALLLDGNIGIGGRPTALLDAAGTTPAARRAGARRARRAGDAGRPHAHPPRGRRARSATGFAGRTSRRTRSAGTPSAAGLRVQETWETNGRWFACLAR